MSDYNDFQSLIPAGESTSGATPLWWEPQTIHPNIVTELRRRSNKVNIGMYNTNDICLNFTPENYWKYRGPMTPWIRCFSNGTGERNNKSIPSSKYLGGKPYDGFLLQGGEGFYRGYGVSYENNSLNKTDQIIGYQADGTPHYIKSDTKNNFYNIAGDKFTPSMLPPPGVVSADIRCIKDNFLSYVTINWKCFGLAQLEYLIPFFLTPGINIFLELGWNLFNYKSLIDYKDVRYDLDHPENSSDVVKLVTNPQYVTEKFYESMGNYGCFSGIIWKYDINQKDGIEFDCRTEIVSRQNFYAGYIINKNDKKNNSIGTWITQNLKNIRDVLKIHKNVSIVETTDSHLLTSTTTFPGAKFAMSSEYNNMSVEDIRKAAENINENIEKTQNYIDEYTGSNGEHLSKDLIKEKYEQEYDNLPESKKNPVSNFFGLNRNYTGNFANVYESQRYTVNKNKYVENKLKNDTDYKNITDAEFELSKFKRDYSTALEHLQEKIDNFVQYFNLLINNDISKTHFYDGKSEDRVFIYPEFGFEDASVKDRHRINSLFTIDSVDDSMKKSDQNFGWVQLDFIFELINYLSKINDNDKYLSINIKDTIVTAHPNLISIDPDVIIPNAIAPKLNVPTPIVTNPSIEDKTSSKSLRDLFGSVLSMNKDQYKNETSTLNEGEKSKQIILNRKKYDFNTESFLTEQNENIVKFIDQISTGNSINISDNEYDYINRSFKKCKNKFLIKDETMRDNIDMIVNRYYHIRHSNEDTSIPALQDIEIKDKDRISNRVYKKYNYGYLRYVYISIKRIISIYDSLPENATLKSFAVGILQAVNSAVCDYWNLDIVSDGKGGLMVIDKGLGADPQIPVYTFEIGTTNSPVKKFSFNINLSNEQTVQVLYSSGANTKSINGEKIDTSAASCSEVKEKNLPAFSYKDRINKLIYEEYVESKPNISIAKYNEDIQLLQTSYDIPNTNIVRIKDNNNKYSYVCLNMPPALKPYIKDILYTPLVIEGEDEEEIKDKVQKADEDNGYTGPADNFTVTLTFDGIMGFRMLEYFAIENLPKPYNKENVMFVISEVRHQISKNGWETVVTAMLKSSKNQNFRYIII